MTDLRAFLRRHIEAFLDYEFGPAAEQNVTPPGCRRPVWTPDHTQRLVDHLAANWKPVEGSQQQCIDGPCPYRYCYIHNPAPEGYYAEQDRLHADPGEIAADNAQADAAPTHRAGCAYCSTRFDCGCDSPGARHMCPRCDDAAEESKMAAPTLRPPDRLGRKAP